MKKIKTMFGDSVYAYDVYFEYSDKAKALEYFKQFVNRGRVVVSDVSIEPHQQSAIFRIVTIGGIEYFKTMLPGACKEFDVKFRAITDETKKTPVTDFELAALNYLFWVFQGIENELKDFLDESGRYFDPQKFKGGDEVDDMLAAIRKRRAELKAE
jgi:hypothetical protein